MLEMPLMYSFFSKISSKIQFNKNFFIGVSSPFYPIITLKYLEKVNNFIKKLSKIEKSGFFKPNVEYKLEEHYFYQKSVFNVINVEVDYYNKTKSVTSRYFLKTSRKEFFLNIKNSIKNFILEQLNIFMLDIKTTFLPLITVIKQLKLKNFKQMYYIILYTVYNL
jgi:hypothetical protein